MKTKSHFSTNIDPYRAGAEIGEALAKIKPEVIFIFTTIHHKGSPELAEAIYDTLEQPDVILFGCTGDGFFEKNRVSDVGVSALAINSEGKAKWHIACQSGIKEDPFTTTKQCVQNVTAACQKSEPQLFFILSDFRTDSNQIVKALEESVSAPVVGGLTGDSNLKVEQCFLYINREVLVDAIIVMAIEGEIKFDIKMAHNLQTIGNPGTITGSKGLFLKTINELPVTDFIEQEIGKPVELVDSGIITFKVKKSKNSSDTRLRSIVFPHKKKNKAVTVLGAIEQGEHIQICLAKSEDIIQEVQSIGKSLDELSFKPQAAIVISCAGRKQLLGNKNEYEVSALLSHKNSPPAIAGFPSFGEFGPVKLQAGYSKPLFHNMTYILFLLG